MNNIVQQYSISVINISLVRNLPQTLTTLVARENNILSIDPNAIKQLPTSLTKIDISENNLIMDPESIPLEEMEALETLIVHSGRDECFVSEENYVVKSLVDEYDWHQFENKTVKQKLDNRKTFREQEKTIIIPRNLKYVRINIDDSHDYLISDIDHRNNLAELDLSCSYLPTFDLDILMHLPKLRLLNVRRSSVHFLSVSENGMSSLKVLLLGGNLLTTFLTFYTRPLAGFNNLSYLELSRNQIFTTSGLPKDSFVGISNLEYLLLDGNPLTHFVPDISHMANLKMLNLKNTHVSQLPSYVRSHIDLLCRERPVQIRVNMADCPIQCDCFNLEFLKWMVNSPAFDARFFSYRCIYSDTSLKVITDGYQETIRVLDRECARNYPTFLLVLAGTSVLLFVVIGAILYRLRWKIRYLYYAAYLKFKDKHKNDDHEFTYDVFLSYDSEDQAFVTRTLSPELENRGLKLLIHTRDFVAGTYITSNIVMAVTESRKTLVVLTRDLLESTWCNYELQMATIEAVYTGRQVLVFLLKDDIPSKELDVELLRHIRSNTYLPYPTPEEEGDEDIMRKFYDKLAHDLRC